MKRRTDTKGSILIWTLLLGALLLTATFFFMIRQSTSGKSQIETIEYQNNKEFFESYVDYIKSLDVTELNSIKGRISFEDITGSITNEVEEITGVLDSGDDITYEFNGNLNIEWNKCGDSNNSDLVLDGTEKSYTGGNCGTADYDDITVENIIAASFNLLAPNAPFYYRITAVDPVATTLLDKKWHLNLTMNLGYGKKLEVDESFYPAP